MKRIIIIRSLRVALVLAILCASVYLSFLKSWGFVLLILASIFFLDASDSMLVWRLKRIEDPQMRNSFIYVYLAFTLVAIGSCAYALLNRYNLEFRNPYTLMWILYSVLVLVFSFRYFIIVVRVMARFLDEDYED